MDYPTRKHPRLDSYDYKLPGYYFVTVQTASCDICLSEISASSTYEAEVHLSELGKIAEEQLLALPQRYPRVEIDKYVIMPTHIHVILVLREPSGPSLTDILCAYKSLTTRLCNQQFHTSGKKLFQTSFYETVLRSDRAYAQCWHYIDENPAKWLLQKIQQEKTRNAAGASPRPTGGYL